MGNISFDFNNMLSFNVGSKHGVDAKEFAAARSSLKEALAHLKKLTADHDERVGHGLEWTRLGSQPKSLLDEIRQLAKDITSNYENVISLGIGGSYLGLKACQDALAQAYYNEFESSRKGCPRIFFEGNNLDPNTLNVLLDNLDPKKTFVIVISKSGETTETKAAFLKVMSWLKKARGKDYARQIAVITDPDSGSLRAFIEEQRKKDKRAFSNLPLLKGVGGRYSEFNMGLLHMALCGVSIDKALSGVRSMSKACLNDDVLKNPACVYAGLNYLLYRNKSKPIAVVMAFSETLKSTADWYAQLLAESLGKKNYRKIIRKDGRELWLEGSLANVGRTPVISRGTTDLHSIQQNNAEGENNKAFTFIRVENHKTDITIEKGNGFLSGKRFSRLLNLAQEATEWSLTAENRPSCTISLNKLDAFNWAALLSFFQFATALEGELLNVNAFDQPGVEGYKNYMYYKLGKPKMSDQVKKNIESVNIKRKPSYIISF